MKFKDCGVVVMIETDDQFLKIKETLTRIGIDSRKDGEKVLYQTAHILQKQGEYRILHFKELFSLDGRETTIDEKDRKRVCSIAHWLQNWNMTKVAEMPCVTDVFTNAASSGLKILKYADSKEYRLQPKYKIGVS